MDGNGRWAKKKGLPRTEGHRAGVQTVREIVKACLEFGIPVLTLYAFSQENWKRPKAEVSVLMRLLSYFIDKEISTLNKQGVRLRALGRIEGLPQLTRQKIVQAGEKTKSNNRLILNLALNYGSRTEILDAVRSWSAELLADPARAVDRLDRISEEEFSRHLYTSGLPDPDLLIRTSGEMRLSNFLLWQLSYAEIYVTKKCWPDFGKKDFEVALRDYARRERRFGDISAPDASTTGAGISGDRP